ncbi:MAG TPA: DUF222 domain-containing protein [Acidimicrobiales bacterium]|nr:DUF222 domain-containing protein [Acidimicrobiales bacterium]
MVLSAPPRVADAASERGALAVLDDVTELVRRLLDEVDPDTVAGDQASLVLEKLVKLERMVSSGRLAFGRRAADCMNWRQEGHRSESDWYAQKTKTSLGEAISALDTAKGLVDLPDTQGAFRQGLLSVAQVREIVAAATVDPSAEAGLLEAAAHLTLKGLQRQSRAVCAAAVDQTERAAAQRKGRFLRHWLDPEGLVNLHARVVPDAGASVLAAIRARAAFVIDEAAQARVDPEPRESYEADALVALVIGDLRTATFQGNVDQGRPRSAMVTFHVSLEALHRGSLEPGELCEVPGVGPVPLASVEHVMGDAWARLVIERGVDVATVCTFGRTVPAALETALEARDRVCVVPDCEVSLGLEIDHWKVPFSECGPTALWNLARLCRFHHKLKTYDGWQLRGGPGRWEWVGPGGGP